MASSFKRCFISESSKMGIRYDIFITEERGTSRWDWKDSNTGLKTQSDSHSFEQWG